MKKTLIYLFLFLIWNLSNCKNPVEQKCEGLCTFIEKCALETNKITIPMDNLLKKAHIQCLGTCTMNQMEFTTCKKESGDSCGKFFECLMSSGVVN